MKIILLEAMHIQGTRLLCAYRISAPTGLFCIFISPCSRNKNTPYGNFMNILPYEVYHFYNIISCAPDTYLFSCNQLFINFLYSFTIPFSPCSIIFSIKSNFSPCSLMNERLNISALFSLLA